MEDKNPQPNFSGPESAMEARRDELQSDFSSLPGESPGTVKDESHALSVESVGAVLSEPGAAMHEAKNRIIEAKDRVKHQVREQTRSAFLTRKENAAGTLGVVADALHSAADRLNQEHREVIGGVADRAARQVESFCSSLRDKDLDEILHDAGNFARSKPAVFLGGAAALGFLAARFIKSSSGVPLSSSTPSHNPATYHAQPEVFNPALEQPGYDTARTYGAQSPPTGGEAI